MFANGKSPINVAKGWKGKAISEQKKVEALKKIIEDLKKLPPKNRIDEDIYEQIAKEKLDSSNEAPQPRELNGPEIIHQIIYENWVNNEDKKPNAHEFSQETYNLAHLMKSYSNKLYELLYQALYQPHPDRVEKHFATSIKEAKKGFTEKANIQKNVKLYRSKNNLTEEEIDVCLVIDACSFE